jgi:hypothetical protein
MLSDSLFRPVTLRLRTAGTITALPVQAAKEHPSLSGTPRTTPDWRTRCCTGPAAAQSTAGCPACRDLSQLVRSVFRRRWPTANQPAASGIGPYCLAGLSLGDQAQAEQADLRLESLSVQLLGLPGPRLWCGHSLALLARLPCGGLVAGHPAGPERTAAVWTTSVACIKIHVFLSSWLAGRHRPETGSMAGSWVF